MAPNEPSPELGPAPDDTRSSCSRAWDAASPRLSVLIPFMNDDPSALLAALDQQASDLAVELVVLDDGSDDRSLGDRVEAQVLALHVPVRLMRLSANQGRAKGRNRLVQAARAGHFLFLDSDMLPDSPNFISTWIELIGKQDPAVAFGGFSILQSPDEPQFALHRALAGTGECLGAADRSNEPEKHVFTSNLLVRRDVFESEQFDERFVGWGWEDVEWGIRISHRFPIVHIDNTASHMGLDTPAMLIRKYEQSPPNFAHLVTEHLDVVANYPSYRAARVLSHVPLQRVLRSSTRWVALSPRMPMRARTFALRLFKTSLYSDVI